MSRFRERTTLSESISYEVNTSKDTDTCTTTNHEDILGQNGSFNVMETYECMTDVVTPNFVNLKNRGLIVNSPMTKICRVRENRLSGVQVDFSYKDWDTACNPDKFKVFTQADRGYRPSTLAIGSFDAILLEQPDLGVASLVDQVVNKAWANVSLSEAEGLVMLAEGEKTVKSLVSIFSRLIKVLKALKRLDGYALKRELSAKQLADRYMELRYALRPLVYDAVGSVAALQCIAGELEQRLTFRAHKASSVDGSESEVIVKQTYTNSCGTWYKKARLERTFKRTVDVRAGVLTLLQSTSKIPVWGFANPVEAIWEIVPFSFIVDWFFTVGDTISAWVPDYGLRPLASWSTVTDVLVRTASYTDTWGEMPTGTSTHVPLVHEYLLSNAYLSEVLITKTRVPNPNRSVMPSLTLKLNTLKVVDLLIIAKQIFFGRQ